MSDYDDILLAVYRVIQERKNASPDTSYTSSLFHKGIDSILKKVGEEAAEVIIAGKGGEKDKVIYETADLLFHTLVLLAYQDISPDEIYDELRRRFGTSGITEKQSREKKPVEKS